MTVATRSARIDVTDGPGAPELIESFLATTAGKPTDARWLEFKLAPPVQDGQAAWDGTRSFAIQVVGLITPPVAGTKDAEAWIVVGVVPSRKGGLFEGTYNPNTRRGVLHWVSGNFPELVYTRTGERRV